MADDLNIFLVNPNNEGFLIIFIDTRYLRVDVVYQAE